MLSLGAQLAAPLAGFSGVFCSALAPVRLGRLNSAGRFGAWGDQGASGEAQTRGATAHPLAPFREHLPSASCNPPVQGLGAGGGGTGGPRGLGPGPQICGGGDSLRVLSFTPGPRVPEFGGKCRHPCPSARPFVPGCVCRELGLNFPARRRPGVSRQGALRASDGRGCGALGTWAASVLEVVVVMGVLGGHGVLFSPRSQQQELYCRQTATSFLKGNG